MANLARTRMSCRTTSRQRLAEWITVPIVGLLAMSWPRRLASAGGLAIALAAVAALAGHLITGWSPHLWGAGTLPPSASERAPLFTQAWIAHDESAMKRFVLVADEAKLRAWIAATPVPPTVADILPAERQIKTVSAQRDDTDGVVLKVQISTRAAVGDNPKAGGGIVLLQTWCCSGADWFFSPVVVVEKRNQLSPAKSRPNSAARPAIISSPRRTATESDADCH
jgi:hypothetical protein